MTILLIEQTYALENIEQNIIAYNNLATFDSSNLFGNDRNIDLSRFQIQNYVNPGKYPVNIMLNEQDIGQADVLFDHLDSNQSAVLCLDQVLIKKLNVTEEKLKKLPNKDCLLIKDIDSEAYYIFDKANLSLKLSIPQIYIIERPLGYVDPSLFNMGVTSGFLGYSFNYNKSNNTENKYLALFGGINLQGWYFRHSGSFTSNNSGLGNYISSQNVLYKDITKINSRLNLGQFNTNNYNLDSLPILGVQLASDIDMLPWSQRSYAPEIENVAQTNALIKIYQNGQKIYEKTVPAGPFKIRDLTSYTDGDLILEINETGGEKRIFTLPFQNNMNLLKKGRINYSIAAGQYLYQQRTSHDYVFQNNFNYGLTNHMTGIFGINSSRDFYSILLGSAISSAVGSVNFQVEAQKSTIFNEDHNGKKYSINYRYNWKKQNLTFNSDYTYYNHDYNSLSNHLYLRNNKDYFSSNLNFIYSYNLKNTYGFYLSKSFKNSNYGYINFGYRDNTYWDDNKNYQQYIASYNNYYKKISYNLNITKTSYSNNNDDLSLYLSLSIPLQWKNKNFYLNNYIQHDHKNDQTSLNSQLFGYLGSNNELNYSLGVQQNFNNSDDSSFVGFANYRLPETSLSSTINHSNQDTQYSISANGAIVAHPYGISLTNALPETYTIIHAKDAKGANVENAWGVKVDRFGNAIYPHNNPYTINTITLNPANLPLNISLASNQTQVIPRKYSAQLALFDSVKTSNILLTITSKILNKLPIGSQLFNDQHQVIGVLGPTQQVIIDDESALAHPMHLAWGDQENEFCSITPLKVEDAKPNNMNEFKIIRACK